MTRWILYILISLIVISFNIILVLQGAYMTKVSTPVETICFVVFVLAPMMISSVFIGGFVAVKVI